jgi:hypothetical protein
MDLPEWDTVRLTLDGEAGLDGTHAGSELLDPRTAELWVAGRAFERGQASACRGSLSALICALQLPAADCGRQTGT